MKVKYQFNKFFCSVEYLIVINYINKEIRKKHKRYIRFKHFTVYLLFFIKSFFTTSVHKKKKNNEIEVMDFLYLLIAEYLKN